MYFGLALRPFRGPILYGGGVKVSHVSGNVAFAVLPAVVLPLKIVTAESAVGSFRAARLVDVALGAVDYFPSVVKVARSDSLPIVVVISGIHLVLVAKALRTGKALVPAQSRGVRVIGLVVVVPLARVIADPPISAPDRILNGALAVNKPALVGIIAVVFRESIAEIVLTF